MWLIEITDSTEHAMAPPSQDVSDHLTKQTKTNMNAMVCNCIKAVKKYKIHRDTCDISENSDSNDRRQEQTWLQVFASYLVEAEINMSSSFGCK